MLPPLPPSVVPPPEPPPPVEPPEPPPTQAPLAQLCPPEHTVQLEPQWAESVLELQAPSLHFVLFEGQDDRHWPLSQTPPVGHTVQLAPQWSVFDETHEPPHWTRPAAHPHSPPWQVVPLSQTIPHMPQFWLSPWMSVQAPLHTSWPVGQVALMVPGPPFAQAMARSASRPRPMTDRSAVFICWRNSRGGRR